MDYQATMVNDAMIVSMIVLLKYLKVFRELEVNQVYQVVMVVLASQVLKEIVVLTASQVRFILVYFLI